MPAQLTCDPIIKITLTNDEVFDEIAPGYVCNRFTLTKGLLKPNKFDFEIRKEEITLETTDIEFDLRNKLLAAKVEVNLKAKYYDVLEDVWKEYDVEDFFYGYIQNIKIHRSNSKPVVFNCTAYSPDARLKKHPTCRSYSEHSVKECVVELTQRNTVEAMTKFNPNDGTYGDGSMEGLAVDVQTNTPEDYLMPYTVQFNESPYDFLKRLARRYGEFMYYENREFVFGKMKELPEIQLYNGTSLEDYQYEMNMNDHSGIIFGEYDNYSMEIHGIGREKKNYQTDSNGDYNSVVRQDNYENRLANSAYDTAPNFFVDTENSIVELGATPHLDESYHGDTDAFNQGWNGKQRGLLDRYVMSDSFSCNGKTSRLDLRLGTVLILHDETNTGEKEEWREHQPLKVVELIYEWTGGENNFNVESSFVAIPQDAVAPPYLQRDDDGFLLYGDFDAYPKSGPQYGVVVDNIDPERLGRVRVSIMWQTMCGAAVEDENYDRFKDITRWTPWIWVVSPNQGLNRGTFAIPEIGDQVLVGYERNNVERPYVIGARYSRADIPSEWVDYEHNNVKGFRSRSGHTIEFIDSDDEYGGTGGKIHIYDSNTHNYEITFDTDKRLIRLESKGNIELDAKNNIVLHAGNDLIINVDNDMTTTVENNMTTNVKGDKENNVDGDQHSEVGGVNSSYSKDDQVHRSEKTVWFSAATTEDDTAGLATLELSEDHWVGALYNSRGNDSERSIVGMDGSNIEIATNIPGAKASVGALNGGDVDIQSDKKNVNIKSGVNVAVEAKVETTVNGKIVKIN